MRWLRQGGPEGIEALRAVGEAPGPEDLPPELGWEAPVWRLYTQLAGQWRVGREGAPIGLDATPFVLAVAKKGWDLDIAMTLLRHIELAFIEDSPREP